MVHWQTHSNTSPNHVTSVSQMISEEQHLQTTSALEADIQKLMKAIVAQRIHIETVEREKLE